MGKSRSTLVVLLMAVLIFVVAGAIFFYLEWEKPQISGLDDLAMIGQSRELAITFTDMKSGIRSYRVSLVQGDEEHIITREDIPLRGTFEKKVDLEIIPANIGVKNGAATLQVEAVDFSPLKNSTALRKELIIDSSPPSVSLISTSHYVNPGGTCLAIYTASADAVTSGVRCADVLFPGYPAEIGGKPCYISYFAVPMDVEKDTPVFVVAQDKAGNETLAPVHFFVRKTTKFRQDKVNVSTSFLSNTASKFQGKDNSLSGKTPLELFCHVNEKLRETDNQKIYSLCQKSEGRQLWQGAFLRMKNAASMARFGDKRTYLFQGADVGKSIHQGIDLASIRNAPIQAANSGKILWAGELGIYGNTVIIDHGQGLSSLYAHLNSMSVTEGQDVVRGDVIARSGQTGFAGGDHLHYSIMVQGIFVNPIEWWDAHWVGDNVELKLKQASGSL